MELSLIELILACSGAGGITGGITLAGLRVEIRYLREADKRQQAEYAEIRARVDVIEKENVKLNSMAERAHQRIDQLQAAS